MKTHYEVLELEKNCTAEQIKDAYLRLSKKYHPDINSNSDAHKKFVQVNEAYTVLSKPKTKQEYDEFMSGMRHRMGAQVNSRSSGEYMTYEEHLRRVYRNQNYNGTGTQVSGFKIKGLVICCLLVVIGAGIHLKAARNIKNSRDNQSREASLLLAHARNRAHAVGLQQTLLNFSNGTFTGTSRKDIEEELKKSE